MKSIRKLTALAAPLALAACAAAAPEPTPDIVEPVAPGGDSCGAAVFQEYVGQQSPAISLPAGTEFRHYRTGDPITMDLNPARINFEYDRAGKLVSVTCG